MFTVQPPLEDSKPIIKRVNDLNNILAASTPVGIFYSAGQYCGTQVLELYISEMFCISGYWVSPASTMNASNRGEILDQLKLIS